MGFEPCVANRRLELIAMCSPVQLTPRAGDAASEARPAAAAAAALAAAATPRHDDEANDEADATHMRGWRRQQPGSLQPFASSVERLPPPTPRRVTEDVTTRRRDDG